MEIHFNTFLNKKKRSNDEYFMRIALKEAEMAKSRGEAARGAVIVFPSGHIAEGQSILTDHEPCNYAEINCLRKACQTTNKSFKDAIMYSTIEPNSLSVCAMYEHGIRELVFGCWDDVNGFISSSRSIIPANFDVSYLAGVLSEACYNICSMALRESLRYENDRN